MEDQFVERFNSRKDDLRETFREDRPYNYTALVKTVVDLISDGEYGDPDPERVAVEDWGGWQGTAIYVIAAEGSQPHRHWYVKMAYGSCALCDALQGVLTEDDEEDVLDGLVRMSLHVVQNMKEM